MDNTSHTIHVRWVRSGIGFTQRQKQRVRSLGLRRLHQVIELPDTPSVRGLVASVPHLVEIVQPASLPAWRAIPEYSVRPLEAPSPEAPVQAPASSGAEIAAAPAPPTEAGNIQVAVESGSSGESGPEAAPGSGEQL